MRAYACAFQCVHKRTIAMLVGVWTVTNVGMGQLVHTVHLKYFRPFSALTSIHTLSRKLDYLCLHSVYAKHKTAQYGIRHQPYSSTTGTPMLRSI